jgi:hypothetical protein
MPLVRATAELRPPFALLQYEPVSCLTNAFLAALNELR